MISRVPLGDVASVRSGYAFKSTQWRESGVPVVKIANVKRRSLDFSGDCSYVSLADAEAANEFLLSRGDIVIGMTGYVGEVAMVHDDEPMALNQRVGLVSMEEGKVDRGYLFNVLSTESFRSQVVGLAYGSAQANISPKLLESIEIPFPSKAEQRAIAEVLGALDDKIAANERLVSTAGELATAMTISSLSTDVRPLSECAEITMGASPPGTTYNEEQEGLPFFQGIRDFGIRHPSRRVWTTKPVRLAQPNDTIVSVRAPVGQTNIATEEICIGRGLATLRSSTSRPASLFHRVRAAQSEWELYSADGTVFASINKKQLALIPIPLVREGFEDQLEAKLGTIEKRISAALTESQTLASTRDELLPLLMSGKIRVKDAEKTVEEVV